MLSGYDFATANVIDPFAPTPRDRCHIMTVRKTIKWFFTIVLVAGLAGAGYAYWILSQSDELLQSRLRSEVKKIVPDWDIEFGNVRFDWLSRRHLHIYDVVVRVDREHAPIASLGEIIVTVDRELLTRRQQIAVHGVRLRKPRIELSRTASGRWNWQDLPPLPPMQDRRLPEVRIEQAMVRLVLEQKDNLPATTATMTEIDAQLVPSAKRQFDFRASTTVDPVGKLDVEGSWNIDAKTWSVLGKAPDLKFGDALLDLAAGASPKVGAKLAGIRQSLARWPSTGTGFVTSRAATAADLRIEAAVKLDFKISRRDGNSIPNFRIVATASRGTFSHPALPFPLRELAGQFLFDNRQFVVQNVGATNGVTRLTLNGSLSHNRPAPSGTFEVGVTDLVLDERLRSRLPHQLRKIYDPLHVEGKVDAHGTLNYLGGRQWRPENFVLTTKDCALRHSKFPYPVTGLAGTLSQRGSDLELKFDARAGHRPVEISGYVRRPGPAAETQIDIAVDQLPIDDTLVLSCPPPIQLTLNALKLKGTGDARCRLYRPPGIGQKIQLNLALGVHNGSIEYEHFPYRLSSLSGVVTYAAAEKIWRFRELQAVHGKAQLSGHGTFAKPGPNVPGTLALEVRADGAELDNELELALPGPVRAIWETLNPSGIISLVTRIGWTQHQLPVITLPEVTVTEGRLLMQPFPYPLDNVRGQFSFQDNRVEIVSMAAEHDEMRLSTQGSVEWTPSGRWRLYLKDLRVDDLVPNRVFRRALPAEMASVIDELDPRGPVSVAGILELLGTGRLEDPVTAGWDFGIDFSGNSLRTGVVFENVHGRVTTKGQLDHLGQIEGSGTLDLDFLTLWGYQLTKVRGPYRVKEGKVTVGSEEVLLQNSRQASPDVRLEDRVTAQAVGGLLTLDARSLLREQAPYHLKVTLSGGSLQRYAQQYIPGVSSLRGTMDGWIDLQGRGDSAASVAGDGQLRIRQAALYELPVILRIFRVLSFVPPDKAAFRYALADFTVQDEQFRFNSIDMVGDAISLRGKGTARFDGTLDLDFYSMLPRRRIRRIPVLGPVIGEATKDWVGVKVRGKVNSPVADVKAAPKLDDAMRRFLRSFDLRRTGPLPGLRIQPLPPPQVGGSRWFAPTPQPSQRR